MHKFVILNPLSAFIAMELHGLPCAVRAMTLFVCLQTALVLGTVAAIN